MDFLRLLVALVEIGIITVILYFLLSFMWNTRAMDVVLGFLAFLLLFAAANWLDLPVLKTLMLNIINVVVLAVFIIFQPEIRMVLSRLWTVRGRRFMKIENFDDFLENLASSVYRFSNKRTGALIVLENQYSLNDFVRNAVILDANFSSELLETIFVLSTPLHDGAIIVRSTQILAAGVILPLADDTSELVHNMGTRHRAALGISQVTDALVVVVSEETGRVSIARDGIITRGIKKDRFIGIVRSIYNPPNVKQSVRFNFLNWFRNEKTSA